MLHIIAAARSTVFLYKILSIVFIRSMTRMWQQFWKFSWRCCTCIVSVRLLCSLVVVNLSPLFVSCQHPPRKSLDCKVGLAGVGWSVGSKNWRRTVLTTRFQMNRRLFLEWWWKIIWYARHIRFVWWMKLTAVKIHSK